MKKSPRWDFDFVDRYVCVRGNHQERQASFPHRLRDCDATSSLQCLFNGSGNAKLNVQLSKENKMVAAGCEKSAPASHPCICRSLVASISLRVWVPVSGVFLPSLPHCAPGKEKAGYFYASSHLRDGGGMGVTLASNMLFSQRRGQGVCIRKRLTRV